jgi:hypothetical protein
MKLTTYQKIITSLAKGYVETYTKDNQRTKELIELWESDDDGKNTVFQQLMDDSMIELDIVEEAMKQIIKNNQ